MRNFKKGTVAASREEKNLLLTELKNKYKYFSNDIPNPGTMHAELLNCQCPVLENCRGIGYYGKAGVFAINTECTLHGTAIGENDA